MAVEDNDQTVASPKVEKATPGDHSHTQACLILIAGPSTGQVFCLHRQEMTVGRAPESDITIRDPVISRHHARLAINKSGNVIITDLDSTNGTYVNGERIAGSKALYDGDRLQFGAMTILKLSFQGKVEEKFQRQLFEKASRDPLTQVYNRSYLLDRLSSDFLHAVRQGRPLSIMMLDLDHFKKVNDTYGHPAGDYVLIEVAKMIGAMLREEDIIARYGGEEFVLILRDTDGAAAAKVADRVRVTVEDAMLMFENHIIHITVSAGVSTLQGGNLRDIQAMIKEADDLMYVAKAHGRNRVESHLSAAVAG